MPLHKDTVLGLGPTESKTHMRPLEPPARFGPAMVARSISFAAGATAIGLVVVPLDEALNQTISVSQFVFGRLIWGALALFVVCAIFRPRQLIRPFGDHRKFFVNGLLIGWGTTFLYTLALSVSDVAPVICLLAGTSAIVGLVDEYGRRVRVGHLFVLSAMVGVLAALVIAARGFGSISSLGIALSVISGGIYGLLPRLTGNTEGGSADIGEVAYYLSYGAAFAFLHQLIDAANATMTTVDAVLAPPVIAAGLFCTGLGYALFQYGTSADSHGRSIGRALPTLLYGFEPIAAISVAWLVLGQSLDAVVLMLVGTYVLLSLLSAQTLRSIPVSLQKEL